MSETDTSSEFDVVLGNSNPRFSGVTSTMLQTLAVQKHHIGVRVLGRHHLDDRALTLGFWDAVKQLRHPTSRGLPRVFHARRNDEMIQALILKHVFGAKLRLLFTSTAQRHHSAFTRWLMRRMDCVISTCDAAASYLLAPPYQIIPHGIDVSRFQPAPERRDPDQITIAMFGRVRPQKGTHLFVHACLSVLPQFPNVRAVIVGAISSEFEEYVSHLQAEIDEANLSGRIEFLGEQDFDRLPRLFQSASLVAALSDNEGFGLTVLEAMASGAAVIATRAGAWPDIIEHGKQGFLIAPGDQDALTQHLASLLTRPECLAEMGHKGREHVLKHYTIEREALALCALYRELQASKAL